MASKKKYDTTDKKICFICDFLKLFFLKNFNNLTVIEKPNKNNNTLRYCALAIAEENKIYNYILCKFSLFSYYDTQEHMLRIEKKNPNEFDIFDISIYKNMELLRIGEDEDITISNNLGKKRELIKIFLLYFSKLKNYNKIHINRLAIDLINYCFDKLWKYNNEVKLI